MSARIPPLGCGTARGNLKRVATLSVPSTGIALHDDAVISGFASRQAMAPRFVRDDLSLQAAAAAGAGTHIVSGALVLLRHGHSTFNLKNRFTGLIDAPLAPQGHADAVRAGEVLRPLPIDVAYTSKLARARNTARLALAAAGQSDVPIVETSVLNDRDYGELQGKNRDALTREFGRDQVEKWRHSYTERPPGGQSIADLAAVVVPYLEKEILPRVLAGQNVLVTGHCDSLRAVMVYLEHLHQDQVPYIENGSPIVYRVKS